MRIKTPAVLLDDGKIVTGHSHGVIIQKIASESEARVLVRKDMQGFVTECGKFVKRVEAGRIAFEAGQLEKDPDGNPLISEDMYGFKPRDPRDPKQFPFEEAARLIFRKEGWACRTCGYYWGDDERAARWCHALDKECDAEGCKERTEKSYIKCKTCRDKQDVANWKALPEVEWDGETPLTEHDNDTFFSDEEELERYLEELDLKIEDLRLVICVPQHKPNFDMEDHVSDYLPEGYDCDDTTRINKVVNGWIKKHVPKMWVPGKTRPTLQSLKP